MQNSFKFYRKGEYFYIEGTELYSQEYCEQFSSNFQTYKYEDTITINLVYKVSSDQNSELISKEIVPHISNHDYSKVILENDGLHKIVHIVLPTSKWISKYIKTYGSDKLFQTYAFIYFYNEEDGEVNKFFQDGSIEQVEDDIISQINIEETTLCRSGQFAFQLDNLEYCYYILCCNMLDKICPIDECTDYNDQEWYLLHLIQIELYVIKFLLECGRYLEAQEILENLSGCAGPCANLNIGTYKNIKSDCGCSKRIKTASH